MVEIGREIVRFSVCVRARKRERGIERRVDEWMDALETQRDSGDAVPGRFRIR